MKHLHFDVETAGFYGAYWACAGGSDCAVIAMIGDDPEDRLARSAAKWLCGRGVNVLTMSPAKKDYGHHNYPLERIEAAISWLKANGNQKIGIAGASTTGTLALTAAAMFPDITLTIAMTPSDFVWQGFMHKALPHKIAGRHGNGQGDIREHGRCRQRQRSGGGCTGNADFLIAVGFQPRNCRLYALQRIIVMAVILFRRRHCEHVYAPPAEPFRRRAGKPILRVIPDHRNHRAVRPAGARPVRAVKAGGLHIKVQVFHCFPSIMSFTNCAQRSG